MSVTAQIAIDIGTTHSRVAIFKDGRPQVVANELASNLTPSYVAYTDSLCHVGDRAKHQAAMNVDNTIYGVRRILGRLYDDPFVQETRKHLLYPMCVNSRRPKIQVHYQKKVKSVTPEETIALLMEKMIEFGERALGHKVKKAIITVPSQFTCCQRKAVKDAAAIVSLESELINETTAAAVAYAFENKSEFIDKRRNLLVYNFGGGFLTATVIVITNQKCRVSSTAGDMNLGGDDFDNMLVDYCCQEFRKMYRMDLTRDFRAICRLRRACEKAKRDLSFSVQATIDVDDICPGKDLEMHITRAQFERMCENLFKRAMIPVEKVMEGTYVKKYEIHEIVMVGGSTRMPLIQQQLRTLLGKEGVNLSVNQDEAAVLGAAVHMAGYVKFQDVVPVSFGIKNCYGNMDYVYQKGANFPDVFNISYPTKYTKEIVKVLQGRDSRTGNVILLGEYELNCHGYTRLKFSVDVDGILRVDAVVSGNKYELLLPRYIYCLGEKEIKEIRKELERYRTHRTDDSERILVTDARDVLLGYADRLKAKMETGNISLNEKAEYRSVRNTIINWLEWKTNASSTEYESILMKVSMRVAEIKRKYTAEKAKLETSVKMDAKEQNFVDKAYCGVEIAQDAQQETSQSYQNQSHGFSNKTAPHSVSAYVPKDGTVQAVQVPSYGTFNPQPHKSTHRVESAKEQVSVPETLSVDDMVKKFSQLSVSQVDETRTSAEESDYNYVAYL